MKQILINIIVNVIEKQKKQINYTEIAGYLAVFFLLIQNRSAYLYFMNLTCFFKSS